MDFPVLDGHMHLDPRGRVEEAVKDFYRAGGSSAIVSNKPYGYPEPSENPRRWYEDQYETTLGLIERCRKTVPQLWASLGPYPVDMVRLVEKGMSVEGAKEFLLEGVDVAE